MLSAKGKEVDIPKINAEKMGMKIVRVSAPWFPEVSRGTCDISWRYNGVTFLQAILAFHSDNDHVNLTSADISKHW